MASPRRRPVRGCRSERAATLVEYVLLVAVLAVATAAGLQAIRSGAEAAVGRTAEDISTRTVPSVVGTDPGGGGDGTSSTTTTSTTTTTTSTTSTTVAPTTTTTSTTSTTVAPTTTTTTTTAPTDPGLVSRVTSTSSNFNWWNGSSSNGNGQWVGTATFRNDWIRHQYLDITITKVHSNGTRTTEQISGHYVPAGGTSVLSVWNNSLSATNGRRTGITSIIVTVTRVRTSDANWQSYSGPVTGPTTQIAAPTS